MGELAGALIAGNRTFPLALGSLICLAQILSGVGLGLMLVQQSPVWVVAALLLLRTLQRSAYHLGADVAHADHP